MTDEILSSRQKREHVLEQLGKYIDSYDVDGINLDFEMIGESGADNYIQFVRFCLELRISSVISPSKFVNSLENMAQTSTPA